MTVVAPGVVELDRTVASIQVGRRHRLDLGDLTELKASIATLGLLQPITISPDGTLICGARRLEAVRQLGWRTVNVWVRAGLSDRLSQLLAAQHENTVRKGYSPREAAALYREVKQLIAEDNRRRQAATRFGADPNDPALDGAAAAAAPSRRTSRAKAARLVTGASSYTKLERVCELERLAADPTAPADLRDLARQELAGIDRDGTVAPHYKRVRAARQRHHTEHDSGSAAQPDGSAPPASTGRRRGGRSGNVRALLLAIEAIPPWDDRFDPAVVGPKLTDTQAQDLAALAAATVAFADAVHAARASEATPT